jgi:hypothetical protein
VPEVMKAETLDARIFPRASPSRFQSALGHRVSLAPEHAHVAVVILMHRYREMWMNRTAGKSLACLSRLEACTARPASPVLWAGPEPI